jgi:phage-related protein
VPVSNDYSGLIFNKKSSTDLGILIKYPFDPVHALPDIDATHIKGRSGDFLQDNTSYQNVTETFNCIVQRPLDVTQFEWERELVDWLTVPEINGQKQYQYLQFEADPQYVYNAIVQTMPQFVSDEIALNYATGQLSFYCEPYLYRINGIEYIDLPNNGVVYNSESQPAVPNWHFVANGSFVLNVNDLNYQFDNMNGEFWLNGDTGDTYDAKGTLYNNQTHFPNLLPPELPNGENRISITAGAGVITRAEYMPRWRRLA